MIPPEKRLLWHNCISVAERPKIENLICGTGSTCISFQTQQAKIFHLPTTGAAGKLACSLSLQNWKMGGGQGRSLAFLRKSDPPCAPESSREKTQHFDWDSIAVKQLSSTSVAQGWHQVKRSKGNTWEIL